MKTFRRTSEPRSRNTVKTPQSQADLDAAKLEDTLKRVVGDHAPASRSLATLSSLYSSFWQDAKFVDFARSNKDRDAPYFSFEDENGIIQQFKDLMSIGDMFFDLPSDEVLSQMSLQPWDVQEKAWLVIFDGALLPATSPDSPENIALTKKFKGNVFLALNDTKLPLEPTILNIQALILLATHVQDFTTPSLCWMLISAASRMLQAMGMDRNSRDDPVNSRKQLLLWSVNLTDKSLALISGRPPILYTVTMETVPMPYMQTLLAHSPHEPSDRLRESPFGARYLYQSILMSDIMFEMWQAISTRQRDEASTSLVQQKLLEWYNQTDKLLKEALTIEQRDSGPEAQDSMKLGIRYMDFQYNCLLVLLTRSLHDSLESTCYKAAKHTLAILKNLVSHSRDVYNGIIWQRC